jgi:hypothetical protein
MLSIYVDNWATLIEHNGRTSSGAKFQVNPVDRGTSGSLVLPMDVSVYSWCHIFML